MSNARTLKPKRAHSVSWQPCMCGCGNFYFELLDDCGHAFAEAWLDSADLLRAAESTLTEAQLAAHSHAAGTLAAASDGAHTHSYTRYNFQFAADLGSGGANTWAGDSSQSTSSDGSHTHTVSGSTASAGSGSAHNNVQPTIILNKIIFAGV